MYSMMHWLVALRVYAYWGRERRVLISFVILWSIAFAATTTEATIWMVNYKGTTLPHYYVFIFTTPQTRQHTTLFSNHA